jgi:para-aminobenzoate synthetase/4-amino-4-deoxychorismate lyase
LQNSPKERAENVMIVDLLRNDVSRIAQLHSVRVERLFDVQPLPSVWQMTSDVVARTRPACSLVDVFAALFPCGSVTGAPKVQAMQMIHALEPDARGVYCGAVGVVRPGGHATFNVPIRTITLQGRSAKCGIGSGITAYASVWGEWEEWRHKQAFIQRASAPFSVLETLAMVEGRVRNDTRHVQRMAQAALHFGFPFDQANAHNALAQVALQHPSGTWRVRVLLDAKGDVHAQALPFEASPARVRLQLADRAIAHSDSEFVRFKTTRRAHYDAFTPQDPAVFDTVLWNTKGQLTECTRGNVAFFLDGRWVTPALACGLLAGIGRASALDEGRVAEGVVTHADLPRVKAVAFLNSLRGWIDADLHPGNGN